MRFISDEGYQELVDQMNLLNTKGELSQKMAMGVSLVLGRLQEPECDCDWCDGDNDVDLPPESKN